MKPAHHGLFDGMRPPPDPAADDALRAWDKVLGAAANVGAYSDVIFDDPAIHAAVEDLGGWPTLCRTELKALNPLRRRFCERHRVYTGRGEFEYPKRLAGDRAPDEEFARRGWPLPTPALVGERSRALRVYAAGASAAGRPAPSLASLVARHVTGAEPDARKKTHLR